MLQPLVILVLDVQLPGQTEISRKVTLGNLCKSLSNRSEAWYIIKLRSFHWTIRPNSKSVGRNVACGQACQAKNYLTRNSQSDIIPKLFPKYQAKLRIAIP